MMSNEEVKMPEFDEVAKALKHLKAMTEVAESHGLLCALFSGGADVRISAWVDSMLTTFVEEGDISAESALVVLAGVFEATKNQYQSGFYDLELLLPDDSTSFHQRIDALAMWCQGFLSGLGLMGFQDALYAQNISYASDAAVEFADRSMEYISYYTISASVDLAIERGTYESYEGSLWSRGILPIDSIKFVQENRGNYMEQDATQTLDWDALRQRIKKHGIRNSNIMAIAPTATISNICGVSQSIEPTYQNLFVKSNLSGEFTVINPYLVRDLKKLNLWDNVMVHDLKYYNGSLQKIERIPDNLKKLYATAFEIAPRWLVDAASRRQKWIDQAQSLNLYINNANGKKLDVTYRMAWYRGLKTTYYLRALAATGTEKSTIDTGALNAVSANAAATSSAAPQAAPVPQACSLDDPDCEACQ